MNHRRQQSPDTILSKNLCRLLRHSAKSEGLNISGDGFVPTEEVLSHRSMLAKKCRMDDIIRIVQNDKKKRYSLQKCNLTEKWKIKANQGHSIKDVCSLNLRKVLSAGEIPIAVHGTYKRNWGRIKTEGINRMKRNHIHLAMSDAPEASDTTAVSGFRNNCDVLIYIDIAKALATGIDFFISENNVILSEGDNGSIKPDFFLKVVCRSTGKLLNF